jgi:CubicO group peptidase (beta-lactamase class C family)
MISKTMLAQSTPEAQGIASSAILAFVDAVENAGIELHSLMLLRHAHEIAAGWWSPYIAERPHMLFSLSKSFTSTAVGIAVAEGLLTVKDRVVDFFPDDLPDEVGENLAAMTVHHLLSMNTGHDKDTTEYLWQQPEGNWAQGFLARPVEHSPGSKFVYNSGASYMLSAIVQKLTGQTLLEYLTPRLFVPLGIEDATWQSCPRGVNVGGWGLKIKTQDIARFGQLYLQQGRWQGQQLVTSEWVAAATSKQTENGPSDNIDWRQGYGYQFWRCQHGAYRGDGAFGQYCVVMPEQDAVLAITSGVRNMQAVLDLVWEKLLPAMQDTPLPADSAAHKVLSDRLAALALQPQSGAATSYMAALVSGKTYAFEQNDEGVTSLKLDFDEKGAHLTLQDDNGEHQIPIGYQRWAEGQALYDQPWHEKQMRPTAASGAWTADDTFAMRLSFSETPFIPTLTFRFVEDRTGDRVEFRKEYNVGFGPPEALQRPALVGKAR